MPKLDEYPKRSLNHDQNYNNIDNLNAQVRLRASILLEILLVFGSGGKSNPYNIAHKFIDLVLGVPLQTIINEESFSSFVHQKERKINLIDLANSLLNIRTNNRTSSSSSTTSFKLKSKNQVIDLLLELRSLMESYFDGKSVQRTIPTNNGHIVLESSRFSLQNINDRLHELVDMNAEGIRERIKEMYPYNDNITFASSLIPDAMLDKKNGWHGGKGGAARRRSSSETKTKASAAASSAGSAGAGRITITSPLVSAPANNSKKKKNRVIMSTTDTPTTMSRNRPKKFSSHP